jgi:AcrR family transcriptional regulator
MPPEDRRATVIAAALPLVCRLGKKVTTRQIAEAAGVAEGTIFRVFRDKEELMQATIRQALDPAQTLAELDDVDLNLPLRIRVLSVTSILQRRLQLVFDLMIALCLTGPPEEAEQQRQSAAPTHADILDRVVAILEPDRDQFRYPVAEVVRRLRLVVFACSHPLITDGQPLLAYEIADLLLDGVWQRPTPDNAHTDPGDAPC